MTVPCFFGTYEAQGGDPDGNRDRKSHCCPDAGMRHGHRQGDSRFGFRGPRGTLFGGQGRDHSENRPRSKIRTHRVYGWFFLAGRRCDGRINRGSSQLANDPASYARSTDERQENGSVGSAHALPRAFRAQHFSTTYSRIGLPELYPESTGVAHTIVSRTSREIHRMTNCGDRARCL